MENFGNEYTAAYLICRPQIQYLEHQGARRTLTLVEKTRLETLRSVLRRFNAARDKAERQEVTG